MSEGERYYIDGAVPETPEPEGGARPWSSTRVVGTPRPRIDAYERVSGSATYPSDVVLPGMLYGAVLRCPHPRARVKGVDASRAAAMPGVHAVITPDSPEAELRWTWGRGDTARLLDRECFFEGEAVAAVAADTPHQAADALRAIRVEYETLPFVSDMEEALAPDAPEARPGGNRLGEVSVYERGDVDAGFSGADVVVEETYTTPFEIHAPTELYGSVARWDGNRLEVWESTQGVFAVQSRLAQVLELPLANVTVHGRYMGGGFGSKLQTSKGTVLGCVLARRTGRPVKLFTTREEAMLALGNRPGAQMRLKAGVTRDGRLTALEFWSLSSPGGHISGGAGLLDWLVRDLYTCPNVRTHTRLVAINAGPSRPFRGPGHPQGAWVLEQMMDALADAIGMDPVEFRLKNVPTVSQARGGLPYTTTGLARCLREGAEAFGWKEALRRRRDDGPVRRGVGVAACLWIGGGGGPPATIVVKLFADGSANLNMGAADLGTGTRTVMAMVVAEELGIDPSRIQVENADTGSTQYATPSGGSKTVPTESPAVRDAALAVKRQVLELAAEELGVPASELELGDGAVVSRRDPSVKRALERLGGLRRRGVVIGVGYRGPNVEGKVVNPFAAQFCEVEVDTRTGEVRVLRFLAAHDSGRVLDRLTYDNQVIGGITMGIGLALTEERLLDRGQTGRMLNANLLDYKVPTMKEIPPEIVSLPIDMHDTECNSTGAKGLGEPVTIPTAAAIANAVHHALGVRITHGPITPARVLAALGSPREEA